LFGIQFSYFPKHRQLILHFSLLLNEVFELDFWSKPSW